MQRLGGIPNLFAPPPRFPQPAEVALAVPTTFGANIKEVCTCVITKEAPIKPINNLHTKNCVINTDQDCVILGC